MQNYKKNHIYNLVLFINNIITKPNNLKKLDDIFRFERQARKQHKLTNYPSCKIVDDFINFYCLVLNCMQNL